MINRLIAFLFISIIVIAISMVYFWNERANYLADYLSQSLPLKVTLQSSYSTEGTIRLDGLEFSDRETLVTIPFTSVDAAPDGLMKQPPEINKITVVQPLLKLTLKSADGSQNNWVPIFQSLSIANETTPQLLVGTIALEGCQVEVQYAEQQHIETFTLPEVLEITPDTKTPLHTQELLYRVFYKILDEFKAKPGMDQLLKEVAPPIEKNVRSNQA